MKKKVLNYLVIAALIVVPVLTSCGESKNETPSRIVEKIYRDIMNDNFDTWIKYHHFEQALTDKEKKELAAPAIKEFSESTRNVVKLEILSETVSNDGQHTRVSFKLFYSDGRYERSTLLFVKTQNGWRWMK